jgi:hypothetical protein
MSSQRRRNYVEKIEFREELAEFLEQNKEKYSSDYMDEEEWEDCYNDCIKGGCDDWYYDYDDGYNNYYDDEYLHDSYYDDDYDYYNDDGYDDWDSSPFSKYNPGNHIRDKQNNTYIVAQDHKLVNILTGEYTYIHLLDGAEIIL